MESVVSEPETRITLTAKRGRDPGILVCEIPDGDTHAAINAEASIDGVSVVNSLLGEPGGGWWETAETDIEFSVCHFDIESREGFEGCGERGFAGGCADDEVSLKTDTINLDAASFE